MMVAPLFVFDASPLVASCQFAVGGHQWRPMCSQGRTCRFLQRCRQKW
jgi:hypothetical protein